MDTASELQRAAILALACAAYPVEEGFPEALGAVAESCSRAAETVDALVEAATAVLAWADALQPLADDGTTVVPVFERLRAVLEAGRGER